MAIIAVGTAASGLDIYLRDAAGQLTDPTSISYDIIEPGGTTVADDVAPYKRAIGHYDARTTTIPSGYSTSLAWTITWTFTSTGGVTSSASEEFTVSVGLTGAFTNIDNTIEQVKTNIAATDTELTDNQWEILVVKALARLNRRLGISLSYNESTGTIVPTPNDTVHDLIILQIECMLAKRRHAEAVSKGIRVRDGDSEIDTTAGFGGYKTVVGDVCGELEKAIQDYLINTEGPGEHGDTVWHGNTPVYDDHDHDGQADHTRWYDSPFDPD
jgi:hypothetical protein